MALRLPIQGRGLSPSAQRRALSPPGHGRCSSPVSSVVIPDGGSRPPAKRAAVSWDTVVFLDVDGVLHSLHGDDLFKDSCMELLARVVRCSDAAIVLSSSWRREPGKVAILNSVLQKWGLPSVCDCTRVLDVPREVEICEWLDRHPRVARWIAIDDMDLQARPSSHCKRMQGHFVRTKAEVGLVQQDADQAVRLLLVQVLMPRSAVAPSASARVPSSARAPSLPKVPKTAPVLTFNPGEYGIDFAAIPTPARGRVRAHQVASPSARGTTRQRQALSTSQSNAVLKELPSSTRSTPKLDSARELRKPAMATVTAVGGSLGQMPVGSMSYMPDASPTSAVPLARLSFRPEVQRRPVPAGQVHTSPLVQRQQLPPELSSPTLQCRQVRTAQLKLPPACGQEVLTVPHAQVRPASLRRLGPVSA